MRARILSDLMKAWDLAPHLRFGELIEQIENVGWMLLEERTKRTFSARLANLPDRELSDAITIWTHRPEFRQPIKT